MHPSGKTSSKFILSQSKKPSGSAIGNKKETTDSTGVKTYNIDNVASKSDKNDTNNESNNITNETALELTVQVKEMRMELERRESEVKDLQVR